DCMSVVLLVYGVFMFFSRFSFPVVLSCACLIFAGCGGGGSSHTPTESHDQPGAEHLNFPAAGPDSPDAQKSAAAPTKGEAKAEEKK
ncbi:MAG: hypothetical protein RJA81_74, partial [Planctomycetota bacterium]